MERFLITFGQNHRHLFGAIELHKDVVGVIKANSHEDARKLAFEWFGNKFATTYTEESFGDSIKYFPGGFVELN